MNIDIIRTQFENDTPQHGDRNDEGNYINPLMQAAWVSYSTLYTRVVELLNHELIEIHTSIRMASDPALPATNLIPGMQVQKTFLERLIREAESGWRPV